MLQNGVILDGTQDMQPVEGKAILVADGRTVDIVPEDRTVGGYEPVDLGGAYVLPASLTSTFTWR